jgi:hypothetical protein
VFFDIFMNFSLAFSFFSFFFSDLSTSFSLASFDSFSFFFSLSFLADPKVMNGFDLNFGFAGLLRR